MNVDKVGRFLRAWDTVYNRVHYAAVPEMFYGNARNESFIYS